MELLHHELLPGVTVMYALLGVIGLMILLSVIDRLRKKDAGDSELMMEARCACGWTGRVSRYARRCPKCGGDVTA